VREHNRGPATGFEHSMHLGKSLGHDPAVIVQSFSPLFRLERFIPHRLSFHVREILQPGFPQQRAISVTNIAAERWISEYIIDHVFTNSIKGSHTTTGHHSGREYEICMLCFAKSRLNQLGNVLFHRVPRNVKCCGYSSIDRPAVVSVKW